MSEQEFDPRKAGKMHSHEEEVRPIYAEKILHKNPAGDMYYLKERHHSAREADISTRTMVMWVADLAPGSATRLHKHHNEALIYIIKGKGRSEVQGKTYRWEQGDIIYVPPMNWHTHINDGEETVYYLAVTNKRLLDFLALDRKVEAGIHMTMEEVEKEIRTSKPSAYSYVSFGEKPKEKE